MSKEKEISAVPEENLQTEPAGLDPRADEACDVETNPRSPRQTSIAMDVPSEAAPVLPEINPSAQEPVSAKHGQTEPSSLAVVPVGRSQYPPRPTTMFPIVGTPEREVTANKEVTVQVQLMETQLGELYKNAGVLKSNIRKTCELGSKYNDLQQEMVQMRQKLEQEQMKNN